VECDVGGVEGGQQEEALAAEAHQRKRALDDGDEGAVLGGLGFGVGVGEGGVEEGF